MTTVARSGLCLDRDRNPGRGDRDRVNASPTLPLQTSAAAASPPPEKARAHAVPRPRSAPRAGRRATSAGIAVDALNSSGGLARRRIRRWLGRLSAQATLRLGDRRGQPSGLLTRREQRRLPDRVARGGAPLPVALPTAASEPFPLPSTPRHAASATAGAPPRPARSAWRRYRVPAIGDGPTCHHRHPSALAFAIESPVDGHRTTRRGPRPCRRWSHCRPTDSREGSDEVGGSPRFALDSGAPHAPRYSCFVPAGGEFVPLGLLMAHIHRNCLVSGARNWHPHLPAVLAKSADFQPETT
jgi:hypothetical protein